MPGKQNHRGPHQQDRQLFADERVPDLRSATSDLSWLLTRGYALNSASKIVGDRYSLTSRQRLAVGRCACRDDQLQKRKDSEAIADTLDNVELWIDGYNVLTSVEAALSGGVILHARDGCYRDMASMHGSYRKVAETVPAIQLIGQHLDSLHITHARWLLDAPVSNSGRLKVMLEDIAEAERWNWTVDLVPDPDPVLAQSAELIATADSEILDHAGRWLNLARSVVDAQVESAWVFDVSSESTTKSGTSADD